MSTQQRVLATIQPAAQDPRSATATAWESTGGVAALAGSIAQQADAIDAILGDLFGAREQSSTQGAATRRGALQASSNEAYIRAFVQTVGE